MSKQTLIAAITEAVVRFQNATDRVDAAAADVLGVNRTDLLCIGLLLRDGGMTAGLLAIAGGPEPGRDDGRDRAAGEFRVRRTSPRTRPTVAGCS